MVIHIFCLNWLAVITPVRARCWSLEWEPFNGDCYYAVKDNATWHEARSVCWKHRGDLAVIPDAATEVSFA